MSFAPPYVPQGLTNSFIDNFSMFNSGRTTGAGTVAPTAKPNPFTGYFLAPEQAYDPMYMPSSDTFHLPASFIGENSYMTRIVGQFLAERDAFLSTYVLPLTNAETIQLDSSMGFNFTLWEPDPRMLVRLAPETNGPVPTSRVSQHSAYMEQHGLSFVIDHGFMMTPRGQTEFKIKIMQIADALLRTLNIESLRALLNTPNVYSNRLRAVPVNGTTSTPQQYFEYEFSTFGIINKMGIDGLAHLYALVQKAMSSYGTSCDTIIVASATKILGNLDKVAKQKKLQYLITGREKGSFQTKELEAPVVGEASVLEVKPFTVKGIDEPIGDLQRVVTIGQYFAAVDHTHGYSGYEAHWRDIQVFDFPSNNFQTITMRDMIYACGRWTRDGRLDVNSLNRIAPRSTYDPFGSSNRRDGSQGGHGASDPLLWSDEDGTGSPSSGIVYFLGQLNESKWSDEHLSSVTSSFADALKNYGFSQNDAETVQAGLSEIDALDAESASKASTVNLAAIEGVDPIAGNVVTAKRAGTAIAYCTWDHVQSVLTNGNDFKLALRRLYRAVRAVSPMSFSVGDETEEELSAWFDAVVMRPGRIVTVNAAGGGGGAPAPLTLQSFDPAATAAKIATLAGSPDVTDQPSHDLVAAATAGVLATPLTLLTQAHAGNYNADRKKEADAARDFARDYLETGQVYAVLVEKTGGTIASIQGLDTSVQWKRAVGALQRRVDSVAGTWKDNVYTIVHEALGKADAAARKEILSAVTLSSVLEELCGVLKLLSAYTGGQFQLPRLTGNINTPSVDEVIPTVHRTPEQRNVVEMFNQQTVRTFGVLFDCIRHVYAGATADGEREIKRIVEQYFPRLAGAGGAAAGGAGGKRLRLPTHLLNSDARSLARGVADRPLGSSARLGVAHTPGASIAMGVTGLYETLLDKWVEDSRFEDALGVSARDAKMVNGNMARRLSFVARRVSNPIHRVCALALLTTPVHRDALIALHQANCRIPFNFILFRPYIEMVTSSAIFCKAGRETGMTLIRNPTFRLGESVQTSMYHGKYSVYIAAVVMQETNVVVINDVAVRRIIRGFGTRLFDKFTSGSRTMGRPGVGNEPNGADIFCCLVSCGSSRFDPVVDITGEFAGEIPAYQGSDGQMHYESAAYYRNYWGWREALPALSYAKEKDPYGLKKQDRNTICAQGTWNRSDPTRNGQLSMTTYGLGHLKDHEGPGASSDLSGGGSWSRFSSKSGFQRVV